MGDLDNVGLQFLARPLGAHREKRDSVLVVGKNIVQFDPERAPRELRALLKKPEHLIYTLIVPGGRAPAGNVVDDVFRPEPVFQRVEVASAEGRIGLPLPVLVWMRHLTP